MHNLDVSLTGFGKYCSIQAIVHPQVPNPHYHLSVQVLAILHSIDLVGISFSD